MWFGPQSCVREESRLAAKVLPAALSRGAMTASAKSAKALSESHLQNPGMFNRARAGLIPRREGMFSSAVRLFLARVEVFARTVRSILRQERLFLRTVGPSHGGIRLFSSAVGMFLAKVGMFARAVRVLLAAVGVLLPMAEMSSAAIRTFPGEAGLFRRCDRVFLPVVEDFLDRAGVVTGSVRTFLSRSGMFSGNGGPVRVADTAAAPSERGFAIRSNSRPAKA